MTSSCDQTSDSENGVEHDVNTAIAATDTSSETTDFSHWQLPDISAERPHSSSDVFGRRGEDCSVNRDGGQVMPPTLAEIEQIRQAAEQEGFSQGQEQGYQAGFAQGQEAGQSEGFNVGQAQGQQAGYDAGFAQGQAAAQTLSAIAAQLAEPLALLDSEIEVELLQLTQALTRAVVGHELTTHPEHILAVLRQGIAALPLQRRDIHLRLHPDDAALVRDAYSAEQLSRLQWDIEPAPELTRGGCEIRAQRACVDVTLQTRLSQALADVTAKTDVLNQQAPLAEEDDTASETGDSAAENHGSDDSVVGDISSAPETTDKRQDNITMSDSDENVSMTAEAEAEADDMGHGADESTDDDNLAKPESGDE